MIVNTNYFREAAIFFLKHGCYTFAPEGTREYQQFWDREEKRCKEGMTVGNVSITGKHYFYMNYCPIKRSEDKDAKLKSGRKGIVSKSLMFPGFWEIDYDWWWAKDIAFFGATAAEVLKLGIKGLPVKDYIDGKHLSCLKTRRAGFSYKEAADGVWNFHFVPESKSYYFAAKEQYLITDGILNKVADMLNHINLYTDWYKNRMEKDTLMHRKASLISGKEIYGYKSEIIGVIIDDPNKVRGKDGIKITFEEAGSFKNLTSAVSIAVPSVKDGSSLTGQISVFGTGGEEGEDIQGLTDIFENPDAYDMLAFNNIWDEDMVGTECGFFVPCYMANQDFMDPESGRVDVEGAIAYDEGERKKKAKLKDPKKLDERIAEFPRTPAEALQRVTDNDFPVTELNKHIRHIKHSPEIQSMLKHGDLIDGDTGIEFELKPNPNILNVYPHNKNHDLDGCVTVVEEPQRDAMGNVIPFSYFIIADSYAKDNAEDITSLGAVYVYKRQNQHDPYGDRLVAWYVARPTLIRTFHRKLFMLADWYNCTIQAEIGGATGGQAIVEYAREKRKMERLEFTPTMGYNKEMARGNNRSYLMPMSGPVKEIGIKYLIDWIFREVGVTEEGKIIFNYHRIYDIGLLTEMTKFNKHKGNFDRISALILMTFMIKEKDFTDIQEIASKTDFYKRTFFTDSYQSNTKISAIEVKEYLD